MLQIASTPPPQNVSSAAYFGAILGFAIGTPIFIAALFLIPKKSRNVAFFLKAFNWTSFFLLIAGVSMYSHTIPGPPQ